MESPDDFYDFDALPQRGSIAGKTLSTGWWELDQIFKFYPGQFVVVTGIAKHGKSTFVLNMLPYLAHAHGIGSFLYVPENEPHIHEKMSRLCPDEDRFASFRRQSVVLTSTRPWREEPKDLVWVLDQAERAVAKRKVELVLVDPWNELERAMPKGMSMPDYITQCLMWIKQFCRQTNCIFVMVNHPTKGVQLESGGMRVPGMADCEGSMAWYNKCDNGLIVWRDAEHENTCKVISAAVREIGAGKRGACLFTVEPETGVFKPQIGAVDVSGNDFGTTKGKNRGNSNGTRSGKDYNREAGNELARLSGFG